MKETDKRKPAGKRVMTRRESVRQSSSRNAVEIESIVSKDNGKAKTRFEELVKKGIPKGLLEEILLGYANRDGKRLNLISGMTRRQVKTLAIDTAELANRIERANRSPNVDPIKLPYPPDPWHGQETPLHQKFMRLPILLRLYCEHIQFCLDRLPRKWFDSDRMEIELISVSVALYFTGKPHYAAVAELLNAALGAADEAKESGAHEDKPITPAALLQLVKDHPEDMKLAKEQIDKLGLPGKTPTR